MPKVNFEKIVRAERDKIFHIATNYEAFSRSLPQYFPSIKVRSTRDNVSVVEERLILSGKELLMMTKHVTTFPEIHEVFVIGGDAKGSHIIERYDEIPEGTKIIVEADLKLKGVLKLAGFFSKAKIKNGLSKIMDEFAKIAEK